MVKMSELEEADTVKVEADIPLPLFAGLRLVSAFKTPMNELITDAVRGELQSMELNNLIAVTEPMRLQIKEKIERLLEAEA